MKRDDIDKAQQRVQRYWYEDGLTEIAAGCILLLIGLIFFIEVFAPPELLPTRILGISTSLLLAFGIWIIIWLAKRMVQAAKERVTYPRTGYVAYRRFGSNLRFLTSLVAGIIGALVVVLLRLAPDLRDWIPGLQGLVVSIYLLYSAHKLSLIRFYLLAFFSSLSGVAISLSNLGSTVGSATYFCTMGIAFIVSGGLTLWAYLNQTQPLVED